MKGQGLEIMKEDIEEDIEGMGDQEAEAIMVEDNDLLSFKYQRIIL